jgi:acetylglutamate synthase
MEPKIKWKQVKVESPPPPPLPIEVKLIQPENMPDFKAVADALLVQSKNIEKLVAMLAIQQAPSVTVNPTPVNVTSPDVKISVPAQPEKRPCKMVITVDRNSDKSAKTYTIEPA